MFKTIPVFILLLTGYLCNGEGEETTDFSPFKEPDTPIPTTVHTRWDDYATTFPTTVQPPRDDYATPIPTTVRPPRHAYVTSFPKTVQPPRDDYATPIPTTVRPPRHAYVTSFPKTVQPPRDDYGLAERSLTTLVVAGVSIALVLLCILIVTIFWYAWKKSQEGSIELNPLPYGEAGVSLRSLSVPEKPAGVAF